MANYKNTVLTYLLTPVVMYFGISAVIYAA